jgi:opacity protein-like surface antigen
LAALLLLACWGPARAVDIGFAVKGGFDMANLDGLPDFTRGLEDVEHDTLDVTVRYEVNDRFESEWYLRFGAGATLSLAFNPKLALDTDVLYMQKGAKQDGRITALVEGDNEEYVIPVTVTADWKLDYIVLAPMVRYAPLGAEGGPYFLGGVEVGFLMKAKTDREIAYLGGRVSASDDIKDDLKSTDFAVNLGAGLQFPISPSISFLLEGRYSHGLTDINDKLVLETTVPGASTVTQPDIKTRCIYALAGVRF